MKALLILAFLSAILADLQASGNIVTELKPGSILFSLGLGGLATNVVVGDAMGFAIAHLEMERVPAFEYTLSPTSGRFS